MKKILTAMCALGFLGFGSVASAKNHDPALKSGDVYAVQFVDCEKSSLLYEVTHSSDYSNPITGPIHIPAVKSSCATALLKIKEEGGEIVDIQVVGEALHYTIEYRHDGE